MRGMRKSLSTIGGKALGMVLNDVFTFLLGLGLVGATQEGLAFTCCVLVALIIIGVDCGLKGFLVCEITIKYSVMELRCLLW